MVKVKCLVARRFTFERFKLLENIVRNSGRDTDGTLFVGDIFECDLNIALYLNR